MKFKNMKGLIAIVSVLAIMVTGCGQTASTTEPTTDNNTTEVVENNESSEAEAVTEADAYPIVIQHAFGETVIESKPERVATIQWANQDVPLALGVEPVGISIANYGVEDGSGLLPWTKAAFESMGVENPVLFDDAAGIDYEAISDAEPDVILAAYSGITEEEYNLLSEIAPVVAYPKNAWQTYWRDQILMDSKGMGLEAEGQALVSDLEALIAEKTAEYPLLEGKTAAFFWFNPADLGKFYVYLPADPRAAYLTDLGMTFPQSVLDLAAGSDSFALELSSENADILTDVDIMITYGNEGLLEAMQNDALVGTIPAVQRGSVAIIPDGTPLAASGTPSPLSIPYTIDDYLKVISEAGSKVE